MAGTAGLEPANAGIKTPCLNQLGHVPNVFQSVAFTLMPTGIQARANYPRHSQGEHYIGILNCLPR